MRGNRIKSRYSGNGTGSTSEKFSQWVERLVVSCNEGELTFKIKDEASNILTFNLYPGECFDEYVPRFKDLEIIVNGTARWYYTGYIDLDARV